MSNYEIIGKDVWGIKARNLMNVTNCSICKFNGYSCSAVDCGEFFYLKDEEVEKLESETDLKAKNEELQNRIKELEEEKTTETKIEIQQIKKLNFHVEKTVCCNFIVRSIHKFCPNCGRKIIRK